MRRADRLFQIIQLLRNRDATTAAQLATRLEVSERTIYRDVADLIGTGVPIEGAAGVGYVLADSFDLPPLMFTEHEVEALVAGARLVEAWADEGLAQSARSAIEKARSALPEHLRASLESVRIFVPDFHLPKERVRHMTELRRAVAERSGISFDYVDAQGVGTRRDARPLGLFCWGHAWTLVGWCELRGDFRSFRVDRIEGLSISANPFPQESGCDLDTFLRQIHGDDDRARSSGDAHPEH